MIEFKDVCLRYGNKEIIKNLSLKIERGAKVVVAGESGVGKSSILHLILGFAIASDGEVVFDGVPVDDKSVWDVRKKVAYVDQDISVGEAKGYEWIDFVCALKANDSLNITKQKIDDVCCLFNLNSDLLNKDMTALSGGERQRLAIVVSILLNRKIFLLDEITSALDKNLKKKVANYFLNKPDWTVLTVSHDPVWQDNPSVKIFDLEAGTWRQ